MGEPSHAEAESEVIHCTADAGMRNSLRPGAVFFSPIVLQSVFGMHFRKESDHACGRHAGMNRGLPQIRRAPSACSAQTHNFREEKQKILQEKKGTG